MDAISDEMITLLDRVDELVRLEYFNDTGRRHAPLNLSIMWRDYMNMHMKGVVGHTAHWLSAVLRGPSGLRETWQDHLDSLLDANAPSTSPIDIAMALAAIQQIDSFAATVDSGSVIRFPEDKF